MSENEAPPVSREIDDDEEQGGRVPSWVKMAVVFVALAGGVAYLLTGSEAESAFVYSKLVPEVMSDPQAFEGRQLRVEGDLKHGSVLFRQDPCEWRFVLQKEGQEMAVRYPECVVPDTFKDEKGLTVTVQGKLQPDGTFIASEVVPRCPSKYEMKQKQAAGEGTPHPMQGPGAPVNM